MNRRRTALPLAILLLFVACGGGGQRRVLVDRTSLTVRTGETVLVQWAVVSGENYSFTSPSRKHYDNMSSPDRFKFLSSDPAIATVSERGEIRGVSPGNTVIHASTDGLQAPPLPVTVEAAP